MNTTFLAVGDSFTARRIPDHYPGRDALEKLIKSCDVRFNNLEMTYHNEEGYPARFSGGTWAMADPAVLDDIRKMGFNLFNTANNHSMDYGIGGLLATAKHLRERGMVFSGTGRNLTDAARACYLETDTIRVALISVTSDFHDSDMAGEQGPEMQGRPGVNGLGVETTYNVTKDYFEALKGIVTETRMNAYDELGVELGYGLPNPKDRLTFGKMHFRLSDHTSEETAPDAKDLKRVTDEIKEAKRQADYVMVSIHAHHGSPDGFVLPPMFLESFAHAAVDSGADVILGHGPHELRAIEIYKGRPIFYSLGNFIFETETVAKQPAESYTNKNLPPETKVGAFMDNRSNGGTRGWCIRKTAWFSVIPTWEVKDGTVSEIRLHPITLGFDLPRSRKGLPRLSDNDRILTYIAGLSKRYGTNIEIENHTGIIRV